MMFSLDLILLAPDKYDLASLSDSLKDESKFLEEYHFEESGDYWSLEAARYDTIENIFLLTKYLFGSADGIVELFRADYARIFDLSKKKSNITTFEKLEDWYQDWIAESNRNNTMDEYGQIIGLIGFVERHRNNKHLLMIVQDVK